MTTNEIITLSVLIGSAFVSLVAYAVKTNINGKQNSKELEEVKKEQKNMQTSLNRMESDVSQTRKDVEDIEKSHDDLSSDISEIKEKFNEYVIEQKDQSHKIKNMEGSLIKMFEMMEDNRKAREETNKLLAELSADVRVLKERTA